MEATVESIKERIDSNDAINDAFAVRCMMKIYKYQTASEQAYGDTHEDNDVGFSGADAEILSSFAKQVEKWENNKNGFETPLSERQLRIVRKKMCKYTKQLSTILTDADYNVEPYKERIPREPARFEIMTMKVVNIGFPKQYKYGIKFYLELHSQEKSTVKAMIDVDSIDNPNREVPSVGNTVEVSGNIKNGWLNVTKNCHYAIVGKQFLEAYHNKIEVIRKYLTDLKDSNIVSTKAYDKVWDAMNELESEISLSPQPKPKQSKLPATPKSDSPKPEPSKTEPEPKSKPVKRKSLSDLVKEFEGN